METLDPLARQFKRGHRLAVAGLDRLPNFVRTDPKARSIDVEPVELLRRFNERRIAAAGDIIDNAPAGRLDVGGHLALHRQECAERGREIGAGGVEQNGHGGFPNVV